MEHRLAAILHADVQGYSRLIGADEAATLRILTPYLQMMNSAVQQHGGQAVGSRGDSLLAEFPSVVEAVQCAVEMQRELRVRNAELSADRRVEFRMGINLGEIVVEGDQIHGDGINIAVRLEGLAEAGSIYISEIVQEQIRNRLPLQYEYVGERTLKNIEKPVRVWQVVMESDVLRQAQHERKSTPVTLSLSKGDRQPRSATIRLSRTALIAVGLFIIGALAALLYPSLQTLRTLQSPIRRQEALSLPDKPSIVVLPFTNMSGDPGQEYFSDGITEDLTMDLSRLSGLFVIARNSAFTYKDKAVNVQEVSKELGVQYVLEGSVQRADNRVRINVQLADATTGGHVWAERYDRSLQDLFALQDEVVQKIVGTLKLQLTLWEQGILVRKATNNVEAYDYLLHGLEYVSRVTQESFAQARQMFEKALELDPEYAAAYAWLGYAYWGEWGGGWNPDPQLPKRAFEFAQKATILDDSLPLAHVVMGLVFLFQKQHEQAIAELERAVALDPNSADAYAELAHTLTYAGRPEEAIEVVEKAMRLNPHYHLYYLWILGRAYNLTGRYEEAIPLLKRVVTRYPDHVPAHGDLAIIYSELGRKEEAQAEVAELLRINPNLSLEWLRQMVPFKDPAVLERILDDLRKAGLK